MRPRTTSLSDPVESAAAVRRFCGLLDLDAINARQPMGPATVYTPWVFLGLLVYQRVHAQASLADSVAKLLRSTDLLPPNRRIRARTLSANPGAYSRARLHTDIPDAVADQVFDTLVIGKGEDKLLPEVCGIDAESPKGKAVSKRRGEIFKTEYLPGLKPESIPSR